MDIKDLEKLLDSKLGRIHDKMEAGFSIADQKSDSILEQTTRHNGRLTKIEEETEIVRLLSKYPKMTVLLGIGAMAASTSGLGFLLGLI